ncbi:aminotransferase class I/II-fold pyridoxal phosphate-dependent enzyme [bacterium]|nr:aminotransferase class I/II-fold pyridoxal phosphate-dependent enzyme [bacterium]
MNPINTQAEELNQKIQYTNQVIYNLLSQKGRAIYFPKSGVLKQTAEAKGKRFNATIGMAIEDDGSPMRLPSIAQYLSLDPKEVFPYAPSYGIPELRKVWQKSIYTKNPSLKGKISLPVVTNALTHGLSMAGYMFINSGDKIIITDKFWGNYRLIFENGYGGILSPFNTFDGDEFDLKSFRKKLKEEPGKQIVLLNFPNNPAGYTPTIDEIKKIVEILTESANSGNQIVVIADDAYFGLIYKPGIFKESIFARLADLHENIVAVKLDGATKEDFVWGLRVGFITYASKGISEEACLALEEKTAGAVRGNISNASHLSQSLILKALSSPTYQKEKKEKYILLKSRFEKVGQVLKNNKDKYFDYFKPLPYNSGYFMCIELQKGLEGETIRKKLLDQYSTGVIAIGNLLRIAFSSLAGNDIPDLFENIYKACIK